MEPFRHLAVFTLTRDASFVGLAAVTSMLAFSFVPALAFCIGATFALIFSIVLVFRAGRLTEERIVRTEPWRVLEPNDRPGGPFGRGWARDTLEELLLRWAKSAAGTAVALYSSSLIVSFASEWPAHAILTASIN